MTDNNRKRPPTGEEAGQQPKRLARLLHSIEDLLQPSASAPPPHPAIPAAPSRRILHSVSSMLSTSVQAVPQPQAVAPPPPPQAGPTRRILHSVSSMLNPSVQEVQQPQAAAPRPSRPVAPVRLPFSVQGMLQPRRPHAPSRPPTPRHVVEVRPSTSQPALPQPSPIRPLPAVTPTQMGHGEPSSPIRIDEDLIDELFDEHAVVESTAKSVKISGQFKRVRVHGLRFKASPDGVIGDNIGGIFDRFIRDTLRQENADLETTTFCVKLMHPDLTKKGPIFLPFRTFNNTDGMAIANLIDKVTQSYEAVLVDTGFTAEMYIYTPEGSKLAMQDFLAGKCSDEEYFDMGLNLKNSIMNDDNLCLARAFAVAQAFADWEHAKETADPHIKQFRNALETTRRREVKQRRRAVQILEDAGIDSDKHEYGEADIIKLAAYYSDYHIRVFSKTRGQRLFSGHFEANPGSSKKLNLACFNGHYNPYKPNPMTYTGYICDHCEKSYKKSQRHKCSRRCSKCRRTDCNPQDTEPRIHMICPACSVTFLTQRCYDAHKLARGRQSPMCDMFEACLVCEAYYNRAKAARDGGHVCDRAIFCNICKGKKPRDDGLPHPCCWKKPTPAMRAKLLEKQETYKIIAYDIEAVVTENMNDVNDYCPKQYANVVVASRFCNNCVDEPEDSPCDTCGEKTKVFKYASATERKDAVINRFVKWLLTDPTCNKAILFAHNGGGYDTHFVLTSMLEQGYYPGTPLTSGSKIIQMKFKPPPKSKKKKLNKIVLKDSYCLIPQPLSALPKAFDLQMGLSKSDFPYLFNMPQNYGTTHAGLPDPKFYGAASKKPAVLVEFMEWWEANKTTPFVFDEEIERYCRMDVSILRSALIAYQKYTKTLTGWDPLVHATTFASFSMFILKMESLEDDQMAIIPENGYHHGQLQSNLALRYIKWLELKHTIQLQHKLSSGGEKEFTIGQRKIRVDAFDAQSNTVYEIHGCHWHGCIKCMNPATKNKQNNKTMEQLYKETCSRTEALRGANVTVVEIWEHTIRDQLRKDPAMRDFFEKQVHLSPLRAREAFFGGRTQVYKMMHSLNKDRQEKISYLDFCSLYPYVTSRVAAYPRGQPDVITGPFAPFVHGQDAPYRGVIKCKIVPPPSLLFPVIGQRVAGKLIFGLCNTCIQAQNDQNCTHTDDERSFVTTVCTVELNLALKHGYKVLEVFEVYHWDDSKWETGGFFKKFTDQFLVAKQEASGWPRSNMTDAEKEQYIDDVLTNVGITLDPANITNNEALRTIAKLFLNSSWGKTGQRGDRITTEFVAVNSEKVGKLMRDSNIVITDFTFLTDDLVMFSHKPCSEAVESAPYTNVVYAAITTATARVLLWDCLNRVGDRALYCDTDSIVFVETPGADNLTDLCGTWLGRLTDEIDEGFHATRFCSIAPKVYGIRLENVRGEEKTKLKVKGVTMDSEAAKRINFEKIEEMAQEMVENDNIVQVTTSRGQIVRKMGELTTKTVSKTLRPVMDKLRVLPDYTTLPFGYTA